METLCLCEQTLHVQGTLLSLIRLLILSDGSVIGKVISVLELAPQPVVLNYFVFPFPFSNSILFLGKEWNFLS